MQCRSLGGALPCSRQTWPPLITQQPPLQTHTPSPGQSVHLKGSSAGRDPCVAALRTIAAPLYVVSFVLPLSADFRFKQIQAFSSRYQSVAAGRCTWLIFIILHGIHLNNFHASRNSKYFAMKQNYTILKCSKPIIIIAMIIILKLKILFACLIQSKCCITNRRC